MRSLAPITIILLAGLAGCAFFPNWHWEKRGAATGDYDQDVTFCKQRTYSGVDGMARAVVLPSAPVQRGSNSAARVPSRSNSSASRVANSNAAGSPAVAA